MFGLGPATKIYIAVEGVDIRKGFDGLYGLVRDRLGQDPLSGHLFLFANRAKPLEGSGVGWQRAVGVREAAGEGRFPLAYRAGRELRDVAAGRIGDAGKRVGPDASAAAQELVAAGTCCIKHVLVFPFEITGNKLSSDLQSNLLA